MLIGRWSREKEIQQVIEMLQLMVHSVKSSIENVKLGDHMLQEARGNRHTTKYMLFQK